MPEISKTNAKMKRLFFGLILLAALLPAGDKWGLSPSVLFDCWNYRVVIDNPNLLERVEWQLVGLVGANTQRIMAWGWIANRTEAEADKIMVPAYKGGHINPEFGPALRRYLEMQKKYNMQTVLDIFCQPYRGKGTEADPDWAQFMPFGPGLFEDAPDMISRRAEWVEFLWQQCQGYDVIFSVGNELESQEGPGFGQADALVNEILGAGVPKNKITGNYLLHARTMKILLSHGVTFDRMMIGACSSNVKSQADDIKGYLDMWLGPKYHIDLGTVLRRQIHGVGIVDKMLQDFLRYMGGSSTAWFLSNDGIWIGKSPCDCADNFGRHDCKPSREEQKLMFSWACDAKGPTTKLWIIETINEGIWENEQPVKDKLINLGCILDGFRGVIDEYTRRYGPPENMTRWQGQEYVYLDPVIPPPDECQNDVTQKCWDGSTIVVKRCQVCSDGARRLIDTGAQCPAQPVITKKHSPWAIIGLAATAVASIIYAIFGKKAPKK